MDRQLIEQYVAEAGDLAKSIAGLSREDLLAFPVPGTWSIQQIVLHVVDSDLVHSDRMKRVIAEERPLLIGYDESKFAARLHYDVQDTCLACEVFAINRRLTGDILRHLPEADFQRSGIHSERGKVTLEDLLVGAVEHVQHHLRFVRQKRALLGKAN
jgi:uncharacterized damage-inducible protein DinB